MVYKRLILACVFLAFSSISAYGQRPEFGVNIGGSGYIGELNQYNLLDVSGYNLGFFGKINFNPHFGLGVHYNYGQMGADDLEFNKSNFIGRDLSFRTTLNELALIGNFNLFDLHTYGKQGRITPFIFAGLGGLIFNPKEAITGNQLREQKNQGQLSPYKNYTLIIPYGAGLSYKMTTNLNLLTQVGYREVLFSTADYLDDISDTLAKVPFNPSAHTVGTQRGDSRKRDTYLFVNIGISYTFVSPKCFTF